MRRAFVTGITGQDGAYLTALLIAKGYKVYGGYRRASAQNFWRLRDLGVYSHEQLTLVEMDLTDLGSIIRALSASEPDELYNLAAQSFVAVSFKEPHTTAQISALGVLNLFEAIRIVNPKIKVYQASSAEMFGKAQAVPQREDTPFYPRSPYGIAKLFSHWTAINYRESYGIFASSGILFNHESPLRGPEFVTRKITIAAAKIKLGSEDTLHLGNLDAQRDWGFAGEFVDGMWRMLQSDQPDTFLLATGVMSTVRDFASLSFAAAGIDLEWAGAGLAEVGRCMRTGRILVSVDPSMRRPADVELLVGNAQKAREILGWRCNTPVDKLAELMVRTDMERIARGDKL